MNSCILYRRGVDNEDEDDFRAAEQVFDGAIFQQRTHVPKNKVVIGRFSVLPFYLELEKDLATRSSRLVNSYRQHQFIADMREWCEALGDMTPRLYHRLQDLPEDGPFVVKGQTNSRKHQWSTHMYARTRREASEVAARLADDSLIGQQEIYARDYVPLKAYLNGLNGMPVTEEYRFFVAKKQIIGAGFYWGSHIDEIKDLYPEEMHPAWRNVPLDFLAEAIRRIGDNAEFYTLDVARKADGSWMVVEINDGQMAGLSMCDPMELYRNLRWVYG